MSEWMKVAEVAKMLRLTTRTVYDMLKDRQIAHVKTGVGRKYRRILVARSDVEAYIEARKIEARVDR